MSIEKNLFNPISKQTAIDYLEKKSNRGTVYPSAKIAELWDNEAKTRAFFSARVAKTDILEGLRYRINQVVQGKGTTSDARHWIKEFLRTDGASALNEMGFLPVNEKDLLSELGSTRRINLIIEQNVRQAHAVGEYRQFQEDADIFPYLQYKTRDNGRVRDSHYRLHNLIFEADDPIWGRILPPNDFNCFCWVEQRSRSEVEGKWPVSHRLPKDLEDGKVKLSPSGYSFDVTRGMTQALSDKPRWSDTLKEKYKDEVAPFLKSQIRFLEERKNVWLNELAHAKKPAYKTLCEQTVERIEKTISEYVDLKTYKQFLKDEAKKVQREKNNLKALRKRYITALTADNSSIELKSIVEKFKDDLSIEYDDTVSRHWGYIQKITIKRPSNRGTYRHEFGHFIDNKVCIFQKKQKTLEYLTNQGSKNTVGRKYRKTFEKYNNLLADGLTNAGRKARSELFMAVNKEFTFKELKQRQYGAFQDIIEGLSKGKVKFVWGHGAKYYAGANKAEREVFANLFEMYSSNTKKTYKKQIAFIKKQFPGLYEDFELTIKEIYAIIK